jgi:hypothetical protein
LSVTYCFWGGFFFLLGFGFINNRVVCLQKHMHPRPHLESFDGEKRVERKSSAEHDVDEQAIPRCARRA